MYVYNNFEDFVFLPTSEFDLGSFCKYVSPVYFSRLKHLRLDANNITHANMPPETSNCLRQASDIMFE